MLLSRKTGTNLSLPKSVYRFNVIWIEHSIAVLFEMRMVLWVPGDNEQRKDSSFDSKGRGDCAGHNVTHYLTLSGWARERGGPRDMMGTC